MKYRLIEKTLDDALSISSARNSAAVNVGHAGGDSVAFVLNVTSTSTPGTANITLQGSIDGTSYVAIGSAVNVTTTGVLSLSQDRPVFNYYRVAYAIASGSYVGTLKVLVKGDKDV